MRVDNGAPWGTWADLPPDLALWLIGLGIDPVWNRPHHKQGNAVVERAHGVCQRWVEPATCGDLAALQARLDWATRQQRERYPLRDGTSRLSAFPALATGGRAYDPAQEAASFDVRRVWAFLATRVWQRRVDKVGRISLYNRAVAVGRRWAGSDVLVRLAVEDDEPHWVISDAHGTTLRQHPAAELSAERIRHLTVSRRRPRAKLQDHGGA
jgi:hypothetical protein